MRIKQAAYLEAYQIKIQLNDGIEKVVNLENWLKNTRHPSNRKFLDVSLFKNFKIEAGFLSWGNGEMELDAEALMD